MRHIVLILVALSATACSGKKVKQVYKPSSSNTFVTECEDGEQDCFKNAREHCEDNDFEIVKKGTKQVGDDKTIETLEFKCI